MSRSREPSSLAPAHASTFAARTRVASAPRYPSWSIISSERHRHSVGLAHSSGDTLTDATKSHSRHAPRKKRRLDAGRRRSPETDAPRPMTDDQLQETERTFACLRDLEPVHRKDADAVVRLVADFRQLRLLLRDAYMSINEHDATFPREVWKRLQAELLRR